MFLRDQCAARPHRQAAGRRRATARCSVGAACCTSGTEVEIKLPGRFKVSPQIAGAIKAVPGRHYRKRLLNEFQAASPAAQFGLIPGAADIHAPLVEFGLDGSASISDAGSGAVPRPSAERRCFICSVVMISAASLPRRVAISVGILAGPNRPFQNVRSKPFTPSSCIVATSGISGVRMADEMAIARTCPFFTAEKSSSNIDKCHCEIAADDIGHCLRRALVGHADHVDPVFALDAFGRDLRTAVGRAIGQLAGIRLWLPS